MHLLKRNFILIGIICLHLSLMLTLKFTAWPEMLAYSYLVSRGFRFYEDLIHPYLPLLPFVILVVSQLTGFTLITLQIITYLTLVVSDVLMWRIAGRWLSHSGTILTVVLYAWLTVVFAGNGLWFDLFLVPYLILAWDLFSSYLTNRQSRTLYLTSSILGLAFLIKQTAAVYEIFILLYVCRNKTFRTAIFAAIFFLLPFFVVLVLFPLPSVWQWGIIFPLTTISRLPGYVLYPTTKQTVLLLLTFLPVLLWSTLKDAKVLRLRWWFFISLLFLFPRFDYFHLQPLLPFFALGTALTFARLKKNPLYVKLGIVYLLFMVGWGLRMITRDFNQPPRFFSRSTYVVGDFLDRLLPNDEPIFFYNTPANYFITAKLLPLKPWVDNFPWYMELPGVQTQIVDALDKNQIEWVVFTKFGTGGEYELGSYKPKLIDQYINDHYKPLTAVTDQIQVWRRLQ